MKTNKLEQSLSRKMNLKLREMTSRFRARGLRFCLCWLLNLVLFLQMALTPVAPLFAASRNESAQPRENAPVESEVPSGKVATAQAGNPIIIFGLDGLIACQDRRATSRSSSRSRELRSPPTPSACRTGRLTAPAG